MKKILYFVCSVIFFLSFKSNVFAYVNNVTLNYDNYHYILEDSYYSDIINNIRTVMKSTDYFYDIRIYTTSDSTCYSDYPKNQSKYNSDCTLSSIQSHKFGVTVTIYNPNTYNLNDKTVNNLYFNLSGGGSGIASTAYVGPIISNDLYSSNSNYMIYNNTSPGHLSARSFVFYSNDLSNLLTWLNNENRTWQNVPGVGLTFHLSDSSSYTPYNFTADYVPFFIYKNFVIPGKYLRFNNSNLSSRISIIKDSDNFSPVVNEDFSYFIAINQIIPPVVNDLGEGTTTFNGNSIKISSNNFSNSIVCPIDRPFNDNFCYINNTDFVSSSDLSNMNLTLDFDLGNTYVSFEEGHYYSFTFRVSSSSTLNVRAMGINSGQISSNVEILQVIKHDNGVYTDYQIIFKPNSSFTSSYSLSRIYIVFNGFVDSDYDSYSYGVYRNYRYHDFGISQPSTNDINNDYTINNIDTITSDTSNWFTGFHLNDRGLSSIITAPFRYFRYIINSNGVCSSLTLPTYYFGNIQLPCVQSIIYSKIPDIINLYRVIMSGIICYYVIVGYYKLAMVCFNPTDSRIEVVDL